MVQPEGYAGIDGARKMLNDMVYKAMEKYDADIAVMTTILQMTDCKTSSFVQMKKLALLRCKDPCSKKTFVTFNHDHLKQKVSQLQSSSARKLMTDTFADLFKGISE